MEKNLSLHQKRVAAGLHGLLASLFTNAKLPAIRDTFVDQITGYDEMHGYPEGAYGDDTIGLSWGDVGHGLNVALNPFEQARWIGRRFGVGGGQGPAQQRQPIRAPQLPPSATQAYQRGPSKLLAYMGLGTLKWVSTDTSTEKLLSAEPQAAFRGRRLVCAQAKSTGAVGILVTITQPLTVSGMPQTPAPQQAAPVEMFAADTTYSMLDLQIAVSGTQINLGISVSAIPASSETVVVAAGLYGEWLR